VFAVNNLNAVNAATVFLTLLNDLSVACSARSYSSSLPPLRRGAK
jgi:hypothetical protein